jgi:hypothetical protein
LRTKIGLNILVTFFTSRQEIVPTNGNSLEGILKMEKFGLFEKPK